MKARKLVDWPLIRRDFEKSDISVKEIARWSGISDTAIHKRAVAEGWTPHKSRKPKKVRVPTPSPPPIVYVRQPTALTAATMDPETIIGRGRNLVLRLMDELDAVTANLGEITEAIYGETAKDDVDGRREAMLRAVSLKARSETLKTLALAAKTLAETTVPEGKKAQRQARAEQISGEGRFAVPSAPPQFRAVQ